MATAFSWKCPYCGSAATITDQNYSEDHHRFRHGNNVGTLFLTTEVIVCPNPECKEFEISADLRKAIVDGNGHVVPHGAPIQEWQLKPQSGAKPFPDYIPAPILQDYQEACLIVNLSPKASATLARRCLQGVIRDFWGIAKDRLVDEINAIREKVDPITWQAIDAVRKIGNIGAHMEKNIDLILEVDPDEAAVLIRLIEYLLKEWYVHRHERQLQMERVVGIAGEKAAVKAAGVPAQAEAAQG